MEQLSHIRCAGHVSTGLARDAAADDSTQPLATVCLPVDHSCEYGGIESSDEVAGAQAEIE
jgi:hypothetical protein